jgi:gliding motility-associated-like protein
MRFKHIFIFAIIILSSLNVLGQLSRKHFIPPLTNDDSFSEQYIYISTPKNQPVSYKITAVGQPDLAAYSGVVSNGTPIEQAVLDAGGFDDFNNNSQLHLPILNSNTIINNKGFIIEAEDVVYVSVRVRSSLPNQFHAGALVSKGAAALGTDFRIGGMVRSGITPIPGHAIFASIMATEDNTSITIGDLPVGITLVNYSGPIPYSIILNEGETYMISVSVNLGGETNDLIGGLISSDKPIVVNSGSATGSFGDGTGGRDYGFDQIVDASKIGSEYILIKGNGTSFGDTFGPGNDWENILIVAHEDNTAISINGLSIGITLNASDYHVIEGSEFNSDGNMFVETSKPTFVYQGIGGEVGAEPNQGMFFVPPLSCENRGDVNNIADIDQIGSGNFPGGITIVTNSGATVTINDISITDPIYNTSGPFVVNGNPNYVTYKVESLTGNIKVQSDKELYCAYFNQNNSAASGSFYSGFPSAPEVDFQTTVASLGNCIPNVKLAAGNTDLFDDFEWFYDDGLGGGFVTTGIATPSYTPTQPGNYKLIGTLDCTGSTYESVVVPVSECPDDADNDLVIDNLDVDLDNDGILNCNESNGDAIINLADINTPVVTFMDSTTDATIISSTFSESNTGATANTFTADASGNFVSTANEGSTSLVNYGLIFTEAINFKFIQTTGTTHTAVDGEYFVIKITPNNKNITLVDPDDQLLVDTNFDGDFETGVTYVSSSEIRFKYNTTPTGTTPFEFVANRVTGVAFEHHLTNTTTPSIFNGNYSLTCFARDSDGDGVEDAFDLDSDNDGILDIYENSGSILTLIGDSDSDGLDDVFIGATTSSDSDLDGILNSFDLDSDNDGIYDLLESGVTIAQAAALDTNNDGIIDVFVDANTNGIHDSLESLVTPDTDSDALPNFVDLDSDDDACFDTTEAGYTDTNDDGLLGGLPLTVDANGKVTSGTDGYTTPNLDYITSAPILLNTTFDDQTFCELETNSLAIDSNAETFQWQVSTNAGAIWADVIDNATYSNATTTSLQITATPLTFHNNQYRVILGRTGNSCSFTSNAITLTVNALPIVNDPVELKQCDDNADLITTINLTQARLSISPNYVVNGETFEYFATQADAIAGTPQVADELRYPVTAAGEAWVRTISTENCYIISKVDLVVSFAGNVTYDRVFAECDDFLDIDGNDTATNSDTDGIATFDFSDATDEIKAFFPLAIRPNLAVYYYESNADRAASVNDINSDIANHRNNNDPTFASNQTIYARIINTVNNDCTGTAQLFLQVDTVPLANNLAQPLSFCDDFDSGSSNDGENIGINLRSTVTDILGPTQTEADFIVTYHNSQADATSGAAAITTDTNFRNTAPAGFVPGTVSRQTIFVRVEDRTKVPACFNDHISFDIEITPLPELQNTIAPIDVCDVPTTTDSDPRNRLAQNIDITIRNTDILNGRDPTIFSIWFYKSYADALTDTDRIDAADLLNYENDPANTTIPANINSDDPGIETLFFTINNANTTCTSEPFTLDVHIYPEPNIPVNITNYVDCDNDNNGLGNDTDGILENIAFSSKITEILTFYSVAEQSNFTVSFHRDLADAQSGSDPLDTNAYENEVNNQTIYVRVVNNITTCVYDDLSFQIIVNPLPTYDPLDLSQVACLNNLPLTLQVDNPLTAYNYSWVENQTGTEISTAQSVDVRAGGTYTLTVTDRVTGCARIEQFDVIESEAATITDDNIFVVDDTSDISGNSFSITIDPTGLGVGDYEYALLNEQGAFVRSYQDDLIFDQLTGGFYTLLVRDKNGCDINQIPASIEVPVVEFPKFFTPNGDGANDTWTIKGANINYYPSSEIYVYNRFGKVVAKVDLANQGWNGTYNGKRLPSDDYWFSIKLVPFDTTKKVISKTGNFSLLRK